jgi:hypothetical protein
MVGIKPPVEFGLLCLGQGNRLRHLGNAVPDFRRQKDVYLVEVFFSCGASAVSRKLHFFTVLSTNLSNIAWILLPNLRDKRDRTTSVSKPSEVGASRNTAWPTVDAGTHRSRTY